MSALTDLAYRVKEIAYLFDHFGSGISAYTNVPSGAWPDFGKNAHRAYEAARESMSAAIGDKSTTKGVGGVAHDIVERLITVIGNYGAAEKAAGIASFDVARTLGDSADTRALLNLIGDIDHASAPGHHEDLRHLTMDAAALNMGRGLWRSAGALKRSMSTSAGSPVLEAMHALNQPVGAMEAARYSPMIEAVRSSRGLLARTAVGFGVDLAIGIIDTALVIPNESDPHPFVVEQERWHKIAQATAPAGGVIDAVDDALNRYMGHWTGDASDAFVKYVASQFVPTISRLSALAATVSDLCGDIARALQEYLSNQTAVHVSTAAALLVLNTFSPLGAVMGSAIAAGFCGFEIERWHSMSDLFDQIADAVTRVTEDAKSLQASCASMLSKEPGVLNASL